LWFYAINQAKERRNTTNKIYTGKRKFYSFIYQHFNMKKFLDENFLLPTATAQKLYHEFAKDMPIIDYHCHLPPDQIANDINFENLTQAWLYGDHYKWRAMRTNGADESYCTGNRSDREKFEKWAATVPYTLRNPLHHWTHLELQRYFDVNDLLNKETAAGIYERCNAALASPEYSVRNLLRKMNVKVVCTTDDPIDDLVHHKKIRDDDFEIKILPAYRPDKAMNVDNSAGFNQYVSQLERVSNTHIASYTAYLEALKNRHDYFALMGCSVSDHGLEHLYAEEYSDAEIEVSFGKIRSGKELTGEERIKIPIGHALCICRFGTMKKDGYNNTIWVPCEITTQGS
jgi:glucuronate isomerase